MGPLRRPHRESSLCAVLFSKQCPDSGSGLPAICKSIPFMGRGTLRRICPSTPMQLSLLCGSAHESSPRVLGGSRFGNFVGGTHSWKCQTSTATPAEPGGLSLTLGRAVQRQGTIVAVPILSELHHCYARDMIFGGGQGFSGPGCPARSYLPPSRSIEQLGEAPERILRILQ